VSIQGFAGLSVYISPSLTSWATVARADRNAAPADGAGPGEFASAASAGADVAVSAVALAKAAGGAGLSVRFGAGRCGGGTAFLAGGRPSMLSKWLAYLVKQRGNAWGLDTRGTLGHEPRCLTKHTCQLGKFARHSTSDATR
jgi:hypothetical protein